MFDRFGLEVAKILNPAEEARLVGLLGSIEERLVFMGQNLDGQGLRAEHSPRRN